MLEFCDGDEVARGARWNFRIACWDVCRDFRPSRAVATVKPLMSRGTLKNVGVIGPELSGAGWRKACGEGVLGLRLESHAAPFPNFVGSRRRSRNWRIHPIFVADDEALLSVVEQMKRL